MNGKKIVVIDGDNTLVGFDSELEKQIKKRYPWIKIRFRKSFYFKDDYPEEEQKLIIPIYCEEGFFERLEPLPGAVEMMHTLLYKGFEVYIGTSPLTINPYCSSEKVSCYIRHFGKEFEKRIIIMPDKTMIYCNALIDDKPVITGICDPAWGHIIFDQPYNGNIHDSPRIYGWDHKDCLDTIEEVVKYNQYIAGNI